MSAVVTVNVSLEEDAYSAMKSKVEKVNSFSSNI